MQDSVVLQIAGKRIDNWISYDVDADLYQAADSFSLELANPGTEIKAGMQCELYVNDQLELTGIIDSTRRGWSKQGRTLTVQGRDLMSILTDSYAEDFVSLQNKTVREIAEFLLQANKNTGRPALPFISRQVIKGGAFVGKGKGKKKTVDSPLMGFQDTPQKISQIEPGMTVFEVLSIYAASRGFLFFSLQDGTLMFSRPKAKGQALYRIVNMVSGAGNNVKSGEETDDISRRYSKITVIGQVQGHDDLAASQLAPRGTVTDSSFPFYKPYVARLNSDSQSPKLHARMLQEKQRHDGLQLSYVAAGHSQNGVNWHINELVQVKDEMLGKDGIFLIYGRKFRRSKQEGSNTELRLGPPGLVAAT